MATDPKLHEDIALLSTEIHGLTERFSAKELLAEKAAELAEKTAEASALAAALAQTATTLSQETKKITEGFSTLVKRVSVVGVVFAVILGLAIYKVYDLYTCQAEFNKATELRSSLLTEYTIERDAAMHTLVEVRGEPNDTTSDEAKHAWLIADWKLVKARELNPVPKYEDYCEPIPGVGPPKVPPAKTPGPVPSNLR